MTVHQKQTAPEPEGSRPREPYVSDDHEQRATPKQLAYLRALANRTGQTFTYPRTRHQASREIRRLKTVTPSTRVERTIERIDLDAERAAREANCDVPIDLDRETTGHGSTATWSQRS